MTPYELRVHSADEQKVEMILEVNHKVFITGLGLSVLPGSQFSVRVQVRKNSTLKNRRALVNDSHTWSTHTISTLEKSCDQIMMVKLYQKFEMEADTSALLTVEFTRITLTGDIGFVKVGRNSDYCDGEHGEVTRDVICTGDAGEPIGSVRFKMKARINTGVITRVYFENQCKCFVQRLICKGLHHVQ